LRGVLEDRLGVPLSSFFVVAYSGGRDSHALLDALCALRAAHGVRVRAVHVDHGLQPASRQWSEHCVQICTALGVACAIERVEVRAKGEESIEAAARRLRYERLAAQLGLGDVLLTAHHEDDQAETVLLALVRGTGVHGLAGMPEITAFGAARQARPLLSFSRAAIEAYARARGLQWIEDTSNRDERMSRNFLRAQAMPLLEQRWPAAVRALARAAAHSAEAAALLDDMAQLDFAICAGDGGMSLSIACVSALPAARQRNLVRYWIRQQGFRPPSAQQLDGILRQIAHPSHTGIACVSWPETNVYRYRDQLTISRPTPRPDSRMVLPWQPPQVVDVPGTGWRLRAVTAQGEGLAQARIAGTTITLRLRQGGEVCQLRGRAHHHRLKKLLQEAGVPPWERERVPLIYAGDALAAIGDRWVCAPFAAAADEPGWRIVLEKTTEAGASGR